MSDRDDAPRALPLHDDTSTDPAGVRQIPVVCRKLRTKVAFGSMHPGLPDWRHGDSTTAVYWCLVTMEPAGPDDGYVHAHQCGPGRACFVPPAGSDEIA